MKKENIIAIVFAILAAVFYAINMPCSKLLLEFVSSTILAGLLYLGAGIGILILFLINFKRNGKRNLLTKSDLPYTIGMIILDILAPIFLMYGLNNTTSANASLLNNFEIVATSIIALIIFKEFVSLKLWLVYYALLYQVYFYHLKICQVLSFHMDLYLSC